MEYITEYKILEIITIVLLSFICVKIFWHIVTKEINAIVGGFLIILLCACIVGLTFLNSLFFTPIFLIIGLTVLIISAHIIE